MKQYKDKVAKEMAKNEFKTFKSGLENGVLAAQIIHEWRTSAQTEECLSTDPDLVDHHTNRVGRSKSGPLNCPNPSCIPAKYNESSDEMTIEIIDVLSTTAYNWANWINGRQTSKGVASARYVMAILEAKDQIVAIMNSTKYRPIIHQMEYWLRKFKSRSMIRGTWLEELDESDGMEDIGLDALSKAADVPMPHQVAVVSEKDKIELELKSTLFKLSKLALDYGKVNGRWNPHVVDGFHNLALASRNFIAFNFCDSYFMNIQGFTEVGLWKQGQYGGSHPAKRGPINRKVLKDFLVDIGMNLPTDEHTGDTLFFASALPVVNVAEMNNHISDNRPSTIDYKLLMEQRNKAQKALQSHSSKKGKKGKKGKKELMDDILARDLEIMMEIDPESMMPSCKFQQFESFKMSNFFISLALPLVPPPSAQLSKRRRLPSDLTNQPSPRVGKKIRVDDPGSSSSHQTASALNKAFTSNANDGDYDMDEDKNNEDMYMDEDSTPEKAVSPAGSNSDVEFSSS